MIRYPVQIDAAQKLGTDGIIGMDFLSQNRIFIATGEAEIYIPIASPQN
jgi:uncharacterized protein YbjQ (UPF0145 family)